MEQIHANSNTTILLCIVALILAIGIGIITARWITQPILCLNAAAKEIAQGQWKKTVEIKRSDEVGQLAESFNQMAAQLQESFTALREKESSLTQFLEALPVGVSVHDVTGKLTYANVIAKQLMGIDTLPDAKTEQLAQAYHVYLSGTEQLYPVEEMPIAKALAGEISRADNLELHHPERIVPLEAWATPIYNQAGKVAYAIAAFTDITERQQAQKILSDYNRTLENKVAERTAEFIKINEPLQHEITERKRVEAEIRRSTDLLESIFNESADAIFVVNAETLLITDCNRRAVELFEAQTKDELLNIEGRTLQKEPFTPEELRSIVNEIELHGFWSLELEYVTKKGNLFWGNLAAREIYVAGQKMNLVRVTDITARKRAEKQLRESKHFIERIADASPNLWYIYDHIEKRNVYTNRELAAVLGYTPEQMQAMAVSFIYGNLTPARQYVQDLLELIAAYQKNYPNPTVEIQQLESDIEVDFIVEDCQKLLDSMQAGAERISDIVRSLRNFSRLDEQELKTVDIHEGIDNTLLILQHRLRAERNRPEIQVIKNYSQLPPITCYASQLNQVFMNLIDNAIDALESKTAPRVITINTSVASNKEQPTTNNIIIRIADNGMGMDQAVKNKIFDPFFTTKPVGSGTGLGLSISYQIVVEKHQGTISCSSSSGKGTEFIVEIPTPKIGQDYN